MPKPGKLREGGSKPREEMNIADRYHNKRMDPIVQREWVDRCLLVVDKMSAYEKRFIEDMDVRLKHWKLNENQAMKLEQIYAHRTS